MKTHVNVFRLNIRFAGKEQARHSAHVLPVGPNLIIVICSIVVLVGFQVKLRYFEL